MKHILYTFLILCSLNSYSQVLRFQSFDYCTSTWGKDEGFQVSDFKKKNVLITIDNRRDLITIYDDVLVDLKIIKIGDIVKNSFETTYYYTCLNNINVECTVTISEPTKFKDAYWTLGIIFSDHMVTTRMKSLD